MFGIRFRLPELQVPFFSSTANGKHGTRSVRHNTLGRGMGQVGNRTHCSMRRAHTENNQVCRALSGDFQNPRRRRSELPEVAELDQKFHRAP
jgi:hypothetical protein